MSGTTNGIVPTFDITGNNGNNGGWGNMGEWIIGLVALGMLGNGGFFGGGNNNNRDIYPWLANGQQEIMNNTNNGFDTLHLSNQLDTINSGIYSLSNQLCNCCADMNQTVSNGFYNAEIGANNRQMANMNQIYGLSTQLATASADNRLGTQDLKATVISENCSDREVLREIGQNILVNQTANTQKIIDEIFRDRLDEKDSKINELNRQLEMANLRASQIAQTDTITRNIYNELKNCPIGTVPVYGSQPIFTCPNNNGCGCGIGTSSQFI